MSIKKRIFRAFVFYCFDMSIAILGWIYGFGLEVKNWWALIFICLFARFLFHTMQLAFIHDDHTATSRPKDSA